MLSSSTKRNPWLYTLIFGVTLTQRTTHLLGNEDRAVFSSDRWGGPQCLFIVIKRPVLILMHFTPEGACSRMGKTCVFLRFIFLVDA